MRVLVAALLLAVEIGGPFGSASATVESMSETTMTVDIAVEVRSSAQAVVAHLAFEGDPNVTLPLLDRGGGTFGIRTELPVKNYLVVFEAVGDPDGVSEPVSLENLGAVLTPGDGSGGGSDPGDDDDLSTETRQAGWLALALAAASLSALAFWVLGGRDEEESADEEE